MSVTVSRWKHTLDLGNLTIALEQGWIQKVWWGGNKNYLKINDILGMKNHIKL